MSAPLQAGNALAEGAARAAAMSAARLACLQAPDGHWRAEITADCTLEADYILFQLWLYPPEDGRWNPASRPRIDKAAQSILRRQLDDGGFHIYAGGPSEVSASVKAYIALKLAGVAADDPRMARLRDRILALGGIQAANSYVKIDLSLFGLYPRRYCPSIPPEVSLLPLKFLCRMPSWTRAMVVSHAIVHAADRRRTVPAGFHVDELWAPGVSPAFPRDARAFTGHKFVPGVDGFLKWWESRGSKALRRKAVEKAKTWMIERLGRADGLGAIYSRMMYPVMALDVLGFAADDPVRAGALRQFERLCVDDGERFFLQPCFAPVRDTAIGAYALAEYEPGHPSPARAADWLLAKEVRRKGDWSVKRPHTEPSGWAFEHNDDFYPDIDDTALAMLALSGAKASDAAAQQAAIGRGLDWLLAMQSRDGGWAAFDPDNNRTFPGAAPFAGENAMLDPACADITGRVLEALAAHGLTSGHAAVNRGVEWLVRNQQPDGSWYGRWGVAYIYGTCFALRGLAAAGESDREAHVLRGGEWLRSIQNADGGWGESCASYESGVFTAGPSTPSQTAWAVLGLIAGGDAGSLSVQHGIEHLLETQRPDGSWDESFATGTGLPKAFYLNYHLYKDYFPLLALTAFGKARANA